MRRALLGVVAGAVFALVAASGVSAFWTAQHVIPASDTASGNLDIQVAWDGGTAWAPIGPGTTISKRATITFVGAGSTLRARLTGTATNATAFDPHVTRTISLDDCTGVAGAALPSGGYPATGSLAPGATVTVCVRYRLSATAPATLQGQNLAPNVVFGLTQSSTP